MEDLYCKLFISTYLGREELKEKLEVFLSLKFDQFFSQEGSFYTIDLLKNKEFNNEKAFDPTDGFLYFPYFLDIECTDPNDSDKYISMIKKMMIYLKEEDIKCVAACDFENLLPNNKPWGLIHN